MAKEYKVVGEENGFIFKDVGSKLDYAIFHPDIEEGKSIVGWIRKFCVNRKDK